MADNRYCIEYDKRGQASCKKCKQKFNKGALRIGKIVANPFTDAGGDMKMWHHVSCIFETFKRARATTKTIEEPEDLEGWHLVEPQDRKEVLDFIKEHTASAKTSTKKTPTKKPASSSPKSSPSPKKTLKTVTKNDSEEENSQSSKKGSSGPSSPSNQEKRASGSCDDSFKDFRRLCANIAEESSYLGKTKIVAEFFDKGPSGNGFQGDLELWLKLLLPRECKRVYNIQSKQLVKLFSQIFNTSHDEMIEDLEQGDVAETIRLFFEESEDCKPLKKSNLTIHDVDDFLEELTTVTKEEDQMHLLKKITKRCTSNDLKMIIRLIKHDLRINSGAKHILNALHPDAYECFQNSHNLKEVIRRVKQGEVQSGGSLSVGVNVMTPIRPMLAEACKSVEVAFKKFPQGMYAEIKYDGERVQLHKKGSEFSFFSRSLKPVLPHKVKNLREYIPKAFPKADDLILDSEVLMVDTHTGKPLPFGTLGKHKKEAFQNATVCLFVFDCIYINGKSLTNETCMERKKILQQHMKEMKNHVMFSEAHTIEDPEDLRNLIADVLNQGLEGLVLKGYKTIYEPGKRHWLKVKKDYLEQGAMADSADLVVLGAYFGTGNKGGIMSIFLMGCYDPARGKWCTVTKVHGGHDDATLERLQDELDMIKISKDVNKVPDWLNIKKPLVPDFICRDPKQAAVWEITGAEFSKAEIHTAGGISIRFPRVTRIRDDKTWKEATNLDELKNLFTKSKTCPDVKLSPSKSSTSTSKKAKMVPSKRKSPSSSPDRDIKVLTKSNSPSPSPKRIKKTTENNPLSSNVVKNKKDKTEPSNIYDDMPECKLPSIFRGVKMFLPEEDGEESKLLKRYFIAYNGDILDSYHKTQATHVLATSQELEKGKSSVPRVTYDWLWDSIKLQKLQSIEPYVV